VNDAPSLEDVPGFGNCQRCPYNTSAPADLCYRCARREIEPLAHPGERCEVCDLPLEGASRRCGNPLCNDDGRFFDWNFAIAMRSGELQTAVDRYKYQGGLGWALVFGRVLAGFLLEQEQVFRDFDLIIASPTFVGEGGRSYDHTRMVLEKADAEMPLGVPPWPFDLADDPTVAKTAPTPPFVKKKHQERRAIAQKELRESLRVVHPERTAGKCVLVYDDVLTDGLTLNEVARALIENGGAARVCGVTLCRQPWRGQQSGG
jgi:predicted amidophosphoribosyltransferase